MGEGKVFGSSPLRDHPVSRFADFTPGDTATSRSTGITASVPTVACPWHGWEFDLADSTPRFPAKRGLKTYPIRIEDGLVKLDLATGERPATA